MTIRWIIHNKILHRDEWKTGEPEVARLEKRLSGKLAVDIGSNRGVHTRILRKRFNHVVTVDANPKWNAQLQIALSDYDGQGSFRIGNGEGAADGMVENPHIRGIDYANCHAFDVTVRTFDSLELDADLVKIDVEGEEFNVLKGMNKHLAKNVIVELHDERRRDELLDLMTGKGYFSKTLDSFHIWFVLT